MVSSAATAIGWFLSVLLFSFHWVDGCADSVEGVQLQWLHVSDEHIREELDPVKNITTKKGSCFLIFRNGIFFPTDVALWPISGKSYLIVPHKASLQTIFVNLQQQLPNRGLTSKPSQCSVNWAIRKWLWSLNNPGLLPYVSSSPFRATVSITCIPLFNVSYFCCPCLLNIYANINWHS